MGKIRKHLYNILVTKSGRIKNKILNKITLDEYPNIYNYLISIYIDSYSLNETLYRIVNNVDHKDICPICGKPLMWKPIKGFLKTCGDTQCSKKINVIHNRETCLSKYGVTNAAKSDIIKTKAKKTCIERYGTSSPLQNPTVKSKTKETNILKYGHECAQSSSIVKTKIRNSNKRSCIAKYGVSNIAKLKRVSEKRFQTMKANNSFNVSKSEDVIYNILSNKYPDVLRQYKSKVYPFNCDFYIPSLDMYIEYNGTWTHGGHFFDETNSDDLQTLQKWKSKNTKYYDNAITTWTVRDVNKLNVAQKNKLNYKVFWSIDDVIEWVN